MRLLYFLTPLLLIACAPSQQPVTTPPVVVVVAPSVPAPPLSVPAPVPAPEGPLVKLGEMYDCKLESRPDAQIANRYWLYTKDCNSYFTLKWFETLESPTSMSYIGLVGFDSEVYVDITPSTVPNFYIKATKGAGADRFDDTKSEFVAVLKVNMLPKVP